MFIICQKCGAKYQIPDEIALKNGQKVQCSACQHVFCFEKKEVVQNESFPDVVQIPQDAVLKETQVIVQSEKIIHEATLPEVFHPLKPMVEKKSQSWIGIFLLGLFLLLLIVGFCLYRGRLNSDVEYTFVKTNRLIDSQTPIKSTENAIKTGEKKPQFDASDIPLFSLDEEQNKPVTHQDIALPPPDISPFSFNAIQFRYQMQGQQKQVLIEGKIRNDSDISHVLPDIVYAKAYDAHGKVLFEKEIYFSKEILNSNAEKSFYSTYSPAPDNIQWMEVSCER